jgi:HSP20 family protein
VALPRWDPLRDLLSLQERMNRLFEESLARTPAGEAPPDVGTGPPPAADVFETPRGFVIEIDLPGCSLEHLAVEVGTHELVVRGQRPAYHGGRPERYHRMERAHGVFQRSFRFAAAIAPEGLVARARDGLLRLEVPKAAGRSRRIPIEEPS